MGQGEALYRAFAEYRKVTRENGELSSMREAIRQANPESDRIEYLRRIIDEEWINEVDKGLGHIERAIEENRQFIREQGEVIPIERVKQVSQKTVEHLARHTENISHLPKDGEVLNPDKLYVVEKQSDYAVYENRFLYMLLLDLREFVNNCYENINKHRKYIGSFDTEKIITYGGRVITFKASFKEEAQDDPFGMIPDDGAEELLKKIEEEQLRIEDLLKRPLMVQVGSAAVLKPPITRTNVLTMDVNFSGALALYDYICDYGGKGCIIDKTEIMPFPDEIGDEFSEIVALTSLLTYQYGIKQKEAFEARYRAEQDKLRNEAKQRLEELRSQTPEKLAEYTASLEEHKGELEKLISTLRKSENEKSAKLVEERNENERLHKSIDSLNQQNADIQKKMDEANEANQATLTKKDLECTKAISMITAECDVLKTEVDSLNQKCTTMYTEILAYKQMNGVRIDEDLTTEERFKELEKEYEALGKLIKKTWPKAKKRIRKKILWKK